MQQDPGLNQSRWSTGTVTEILPDYTLTAAIGPLLRTARHLNFYEPNIGDVVALIRFKGEWICLGRLARPKADRRLEAVIPLADAARARTILATADGTS